MLARPVRSPLEARRALWWPRPLDVEALAAAAALLAGEHDFRAFTPTETQHESFSRNVLAAGWEHSVPRQTHRLGPRLSVQWRWTSRTGRQERGGSFGDPVHFSRR